MNKVFSPIENNGGVKGTGSDNNNENKKGSDTMKELQLYPVVRFDKSGNLLSGGEFLTAILETNITAPVVRLYGCDEGTKDDGDFALVSPENGNIVAFLGFNDIMSFEKEA